MEVNIETVMTTAIKSYHIRVCVYNDENTKACAHVFVLCRLSGLFTFPETRPINLELGNVSKISVIICIVIRN